MTNHPNRSTELRYRNGVTGPEIMSWLQYWQIANMVAVHEIMAFEQVHQARRFCSCMRVGRFAEVTDLQIWSALIRMRQFPDQAQKEIDRWSSQQTGV